MNNNLIDLTKIGAFPIVNNKILIESKRKRNLKINRNLSLTNNLLRDLYITFGDGSFCKGVYLSNINYRIHKEFIKTFNKYFNIRKNEFIVSLTVNKKFGGEDVKKSILFWMNSLNLKKIDRFYLTNFNTDQKGGIKVIYDNMKLSILLKNLLNHINELVSENQLDKRKLCFILDGILNAEGGAGIDKKRWGLHKITISFNPHNKEEKLFFYEILSKLRDRKSVV